MHLKRKGGIHNQNTIIEGERFGMLTVLKQVHHEWYQGKRVECKCDCGNSKVYSFYMLLNGARTHCGCMNRKKYPPHWKNFYSRFNNMNDRCGNPKSKAYKYYGARGIKVEWENVEDFYRDMLPTYKEGLHLDRIDTYGNYSKENCRWVTIAENNRNRRSNILYKGKCLMDWCKDKGLKYATIQSRITAGWDIEQALNTPIIKCSK